LSDTEQRAASLVAEAAALTAVKRYSDAIERAREAVRLAPQDPGPFCEWSEALYGAGRYEEAAQMAGEAIRLAPDSKRAFHLKSMALSTLARHGGDRSRLGQEAVTAAREAVRLAPWDPNGHLALAQALPLTGDIHGAEAAIQEAIRLAPNSAAVWVGASLVALGAKNWQAAISASRKALSIEPDNHAALNNLGVALRATGRGREGTAVLAQAARAQPQSITARRNLSRAGLNIVRIAVLIALIPIGFITHLGPLLYIVFAIGSNLVISRNPGLVLRLERWAAPIALRFAKPAKHQLQPAVERPEKPWSATRGRQRVPSRFVWLGAFILWAVSLAALTSLLKGNHGGPLATFVVSALLACWLTFVLIRRRRG
jgi:Flp pilus assembly protein TadD